MLSLNTDRFWTIMFTIPLPLVLSSVAVGQEAAVDPEPIPIAIQSVIEPMKIDMTHFNRGVASALGDVRPVLDLAPRLSDPKLASAGKTHRDQIGPHAYQGNVLAMPRQITLRRWISGYHDITRIRSDKFTSFNSQAPPSISQAIAFRQSSNHLVRSLLSDFKRGLHSLGNAANPILLDSHATSDTDLALLFEPRCGPVAESVLIPSNNRRQPQRFRSCIEPIVLAQRS